jgi:hypothetical protein
MLLWDVASRRVTADEVAPGSASYLAFSVGDRQLILGTASACFRFAVPALGKPQEVVSGGANVLSAGGRRLFATAGSELLVFDLGAGATRKLARNAVPRGHTIRSLAVSGDGRLLAVGSGEQVALWDAAQVAPLSGKEIKTDIPADLALSAKGDVMAVRGPGGIRVFALPDGKGLSRLENPNVGRMLFAPDGKLAVIEGKQLKMLGPAFGK